MCGTRSSVPDRLNAVGILHALEKSDWIDVAEELAELTAGEFEELIDAFELYRSAKHRRSAQRNRFPQRKRKT
ncbi:hypothetical protein GF380_04950 [Candidatus Uhrbacteria bacterium]|nr:hypothetical protein [Candidatus Uhrbacteria bacterium]MBD3284380.1 hypothetical protein [Candidatus Uhrbacteria bacterium]